MNQNLCNNCGGEYEYRNGRWICRACGAFKPEEISNEEVTLLYTAYQDLRLAKFAESEQEFDDIIEKYPQNPNGYWGRLMARYGIKYERDFDGRMIPTCYATSIESLLSASDYKKAMQYADKDTRAYYREQAEYMERVRKEWIEKASHEKPYDIFICYKDSDLANGIDRTQDSIAAQDLYIHLTNKGYRVFYSHESLRDKVGEKYEPYIFNALSTAKVMLVYGSNPEYITSTWLKNEWTRYEKRIRSGEKDPNSLLVACEGFSPGELPTELSSRQCFNASAKSFYGDLDDTIDRILNPKKKKGAAAVEEPKKKSKAPLVVTLCMILAAAAVFFGINSANSGGASVTNPTYGVTVEGIGTTKLPSNTSLQVQQVTKTQKYEDMMVGLQINTQTCKLYDMNLVKNGKTVTPDGRVEVSIPIPAGINPNNAVVYYMSGAIPEKMTNYHVEGNNIVFTTSHFSVYMVAENVSGHSHVIVKDPAVAATCTQNGLTEGSHCSICLTVITEQKVVTASHRLSTLTCDGGQYCLNCGKVTVEPTGHDFTISVAAPTCTADGYTRYTCQTCKYSYQSDATPATGHTPGPEATCTSDQKCRTCRTVLEKALGHSSSTGATCTDPELCDRCNTQMSPALEHSYPIGADCGEDTHCTVCNALLAPAGEHIPGPEATCLNAQVCLVCEEELAPALGHTHEATVVDPTCTDRGYTSYVCHCGDSYTDYTSALGHTPGEDATCTEDCYCVVCGALISEGGHVPGAEATCQNPQVCLVCGEELAPVTGHNYYGTVTAPTCTEQGYTTYSCYDCSESYVGEYTAAFGHTIGEGASCERPTYCAVCGTRISDASGHVPGAEATCQTPQTCQICGETLATKDTHSVMVPGDNADFTVTNDGNYPFRIENGILVSTNHDHSSTAIYTITATNAFILELEYRTSSEGGCDWLAITHNSNQIANISGESEWTVLSIHMQAGDTVTFTYHKDGSVNSGNDCAYIKMMMGDLVEATPEYIATLTPFCTQDICCAICNAVVVERAGHTEVFDERVEPTKTENGYTAGSHCSVCGEVLSGAEILYATGSEGLEYQRDGDVYIVVGIGSCTDTEIYIPYYYNNMPVRAIGENAFSEQTQITKIVISESVTSIGYRAFYGCTGLTEMTIPANVSDIGGQIFYRCSNLSTLYYNSVYSSSENNFIQQSDITKVVFGGTSISPYILYQDIEITEIEILDSVTSIGYAAFSGCTALTEVVIGAGVTTIDHYAFENCTALTSVTIGANVTSIGSGVFRSTAITEITIPDGVTSISGEMFYECSSLASVTFGNGLTAIHGRAFYGCTALTSIEIPSSVLTIGYNAFDNCTSLASVTLNRGLVSIDNHAFAICTSLEEIVIPNSVTSMGQSVFQGCTSLKSAVISDGLSAIPSAAFSNCSALASIEIPDSISNIASSAFENCTSLMSIVIPDSVTSIDYCAFYGCTNLLEVINRSALELTAGSDGYGYVAYYAKEVHNESTTKLIETEDGFVFYLLDDIYYLIGYKGSATELVLPATVNDSTYAINAYAFSNRGEITSITIPEGVTAIGAGAFARCTGLTSIVVPDSVTAIGEGAFAGCSGLTEMTIPFVGGSANPTEESASVLFGYIFGTTYYDGMTDVNQQYMYWYESGSEYYSSTTNIWYYIPSSLTKVTVTGGNIWYGAFSNCSTLTEINLPEGLTAIGDYAFYNCYGLSSITIPEGVTSIGSCAFHSCSGLTSVVIPDSVTSIGNSAFAYNSNLISVTVGTNLASIGTEAFYGCTKLMEVINHSAQTFTIGDTGNGYIAYYAKDVHSGEESKLIFVDGFVFYLYDDGYALIGYAGSETDLVFPETVNGSAYRIEARAFYQNQDITSIVIPDGVLGIGEYAFYNINSLKSVTIGNNVLSIGEYAFMDCGAMTSVTVGDGLEYIGTQAFSYCYNLYTLVLPDGIASVKPNAFYGSNSIPNDHKHIAANGMSCSAQSCMICGTEIAPNANHSVLGEVVYPEAVDIYTSLNDSVYPFVLENGILISTNHDHGSSASFTITAITAFTLNVESRTSSEGSCDYLRVYRNGSQLYSTSGDASWYSRSIELMPGDTVTFTYSKDGSANYGDDCAYVKILTEATSNTVIELIEATPEYIATLTPLCMQDICCDVCGGVVVPQAGHTAVTDEAVAPGATTDGLTEGSHCSVCGEVLVAQQVVPAIGTAGLEYQTNDDGNTCTLIGIGTATDTEIYIPAYYNGLRVTAIAASAFSGNTQVTKITIAEGVETIGYRAFYGCTALTEVTIPESVMTIGTQIFRNATNLTTLYYNSGYTSTENTFIQASSITKVVFGGVRVPSYILSGATKVTEVVIEDSVTRVGYEAFYGCTALASATIGNGVTYIEDSAFMGCTSLASVTLGNSVETIGNYAFRNTGITELVIPDSVKNLYSDVFSGCEALTSVTIGAGLNYLGSHIFSGCTSLTSVTLGAGMTSIGTSMFYNCSSLAEITIPETILTIGNGAFSGCAALASVTIPDSVTSIGYSAFYGCTSLTSIEIPETVASIGSETFRGCTSLTSVNLGEGVTAISDSAFYGCTALTEIFIPGNIATIGANVFRDCTALASVTIEDGLMTIGNNAFYGCTALEAIVIPNSVMSMGEQIFYGCTSLQSAVLSDAISTIPYGAFQNCTSLSFVEIPDSIVTIGNNAFRGCASLATVTIPDSVTSIGSYAFYGCTKLIEVINHSALELEAGSENYGYVAAYALSVHNGESRFIETEEGFVFYLLDDVYYLISYKGSATELVLPSSINESPYAIYPHAFANRSELTSITIPDGVIGIGTNAFAGCTGLTSIVVPDSVTEIGLGAFAGCSGLTEITIPFVGSSADAQANATTTNGSTLFGYIFGTSSWEGTTRVEQYGQYYYNGTELSSYSIYLYIPSNLTKVTVTGGNIWYGAFYGCSMLTEVNLPDSVTSIGDRAFYNCTGLTEIEIPDSVTSIGNYAFYNCTGLSEIEIPDGLVMIGSYAFKGCGSAMTSLVIPESVTTIGEGAFSGWANLTEITIPFVGGSADATSASRTTWFGYIFGILSYEGAEEIYAFDRNTYIPSSLRKVSVTGGELLYRAFYRCHMLTSIILHDGLTAIGEDAFIYCTSLMECAIPDGVESIGQEAFYECSSLTEVNLPEGLLSIGYGAFSRSGITEIIIPDSVTTIGSIAFSYCHNLTKVTIGNGLTSIEVLMFDNCSNLMTVTVGGGVTNITAQAFQGCSKLIEVINHSSLVFTVGSSNHGYIARYAKEVHDGESKFVVTDDGYVFYPAEDGWYLVDYKGSATDLVLPESIEGSTYKINRSAFYGKEDLTSIVITSGVTEIGDYAFSGCTGLTEITIPDSVTSIGKGAFARCSGLTSLTIPFVGGSANAPSATESTLFGYIFSNNDYDGTTQIYQYYSTGNGSYFYIPTSLTSVTVTGGKLFYGAFYNCTMLTSVTLGDGVTAIGNCAFYNCSALTEVVIPESVLTIGENAFYNTSIPEDHTHIGANRDSCSAQTCVICGAEIAANSNHSVLRPTATENLVLANDSTYPFALENGILTSTNHDHNSSATFTITATGTVTLKIEYMVSSEGGCDPLTIRKNSTQLVSTGGQIGWTELTVALNEGDTLTFTYSKDGSVNTADDCAYVKLAMEDGALVGWERFEATEEFIATLTPLCTDDICCAVCGAIVVEHVGHTEVTDEAVAAGKYTDGLTEGSHCSVCGEVLVAQEVIPATGTTGLSYNDNGDGTCTIVGIGEATDTEIYIPAYYNGLRVTAIGENAFSENAQITKVIIAEGVQTIGYRAFYGCTALTEVTIPASVTSIGTQIFKNATNLSTLYYNSTYSNTDNLFINDSNITKVVFGGTYIPDYALYQATNVTEIVIEDTVTSIGYAAFYGCTSLTSATIGGGVTSISSETFNSCTSLASVTLGEGMTTISDYMFQGCTALTEITIPSTVTYLGTGAFSGCSALTSATIIGVVTSTGDAVFNGCGSLASVTLGEGMTQLGSYMFQNCTSLTEITIPDSVTSIGYRAFYGCTGLTTATIGGGVTTMSSEVFSGCAALETVNFYGALTSVGSAVFYGCTALASVTFAEGVTVIGDYMFRNCTSLTEITIPDTVTSIGYAAFYGCTSLTSATIGGGVTSISSETFKGCTSLESVTLGEGIAYISNAMFYECTSLREIVIPDSVTYIDPSAFYGCTSLTSVTIGSGVTHVNSEAFYNCTALETVTFGSSVAYFGDHAFRGCTSLAEITIPASVTTMGSCVFYECTALREIVLPNTLGSMGTSVFYGCTALESAVISDAFTTIPSSTFYGCTSLTYVDIPDSITYIDSGAFRYCTALMSVTIPSSVTSIDSNAFRDCTKLIEVINHSSLNITAGDTGYGYIAYYAKEVHSGTTKLIATEDGFVFYLLDGVYYLIGYEGSATEIVLPDSVNGLTYAIDANAFYNRSDITSIIISEGVTAIGDYAFQGCSALTEITIPDSVETIGYSAFSGCSSLASTTLGEGLTTIGSSAFAGCSALTEITVPDSVTSIGYAAFGCCSGLTEMTIPFVGGYADATEESSAVLFGFIFGTDSGSGMTGLYQYYKYWYESDGEYYSSTSDIYYYIPSNLTKVTVTGGNVWYGAFYNCSMLTEVILEGVTAIGEKAFYNCSALTTVVIPDGVTSIGEYAFSGCTGLTEIDIPDGVESIGNYAFYNCYGLTEIELPTAVTTIGSYAFAGCGTAVTELVIPDSVISIGEGAFAGWSGLTEITIPFVGGSASATEESYSTVFGYIFGMGGYSGTTSVSQQYKYWYESDGEYYSSTGNYWYYIPSNLKKVTVTGGNIWYGAFSGCSMLTEINLPDGITSIGEYAFYNCSGLTEIDIPEGVTSIGAYAFYGCSGLTSIVIPEGVDCIEHFAFYNCSALTEVDIPDSVTAIGQYAFYGCSGLTSVTIGNGVRNICYQAFEGCTGLTSIVVPDSVTEIGAGAFAGCTGLTEITIPFVGGSANATEESASAVFGYIFGTSSYEGTTGVTQYYKYWYQSGEEYSYSTTNTWYYIPSGLTKVTVTGGTLWYGAFSGCTMLTEINLPDSAMSIGDYAFYGCTGLTEIDIPDGVTSIGEWAFYNCSGLIFIVIPDGVTAIGDYTFYDCDGLISIVIPDGVTTIGSYAFSYCDKLTSVTIGAGVASIGENAFYSCGRLFEVINLSALELTAGSSAYGYVAGYAKDVHSGESKLIITDDGFAFYPIDGVYNLIGYTGSATDLVLPESIEDSTYKIYQYAFQSRSDITSVVIPSGVTAIGAYAFYNCTKLASVTLSEGLETIGDLAFEYCYLLTSITVPDSVTSIGYGAFSGCLSLAEITIPFVGNTADASESSNTHFFGYIFGQSSYFGTTQVYQYYPNGNSTYFYIPSRLTKVTVTGAKIPTTAFYGCTMLTEIVLSENIESIGAKAFYNCSGLTTVVVPEGVTAITVGTDAFYGCSAIPEDHAHVPGNAPTCSAAQTCPICGAELAGKINHSVWVPDEESEDPYFTVVNDSNYPFTYENGILVSTNHTHSATATYTITVLRDFIWSMEYKVSSENNCDWLTITHNSVQQASVAGSTDWASLTLEVKAGDTITITYRKDGSVNNGSDCGYVRLGLGSLVEATEEFIATLTPYCTEDICCAVCGGVVVAQVGHMPETDEAIAPTKTQNGLTEGSHCSVCGEVLVAQEIVYAFGSAGLAYTDNGDGTATITGIGECTDTEIFIPRYYNDLLVTEIAANAFSEQTQITSLVMTDSVTTIGRRAFYGCTGITEMTIPASVTSIGAQIFFHCDNLTTLTYNSSYYDSSNPFIQQSEITKVIFGGTVIPYYILYQAVGVTEVEILDTVQVIQSYAFRECTGLTEITIPESVTQIESDAFAGCSGLTKMTIPFVGYNATVNGISGVFGYIFGTGNYTGMTGAYVPYGYTYYVPASLREVTVTGGRIGSYAFYNCSMITSITLPEDLTSISENAFYNCDGLTEITIPETVTSIGYYAFYDCDGLTSITIPDSVTSIGSTTFRGCEALVSVTLPANLTLISSELFRGCTSLAEITIPAGVTTIDSYAFGGCTALTQIVLPNAVTTLGDSAFNGCTALESFTFGSGITTIGNYVFQNCSALEAIEIPHSVTSLGEQVFYGCTSLKSATISDALASIPSGTFYNCYALTDIEIPDSIITIGSYAFYNCRSLISVELPRSVKAIDTDAFYGCLKLVEVINKTSLTFTLGDSGYGYIAYYAKEVHSGASKLIVTDDGFVFYPTEDSGYLVAYKGSATEIVLPEYCDGNTYEILSYAFSDRSDITSVTIRDTVTAIGANAFSGCGAITEMTIPFVGGSADATEASASTLFGYIFGTTSYENAKYVRQYYSTSSTAEYYIPSGLTKVTVTGGDILHGAFYACTMLTEINLEEGVTSIGDRAFMNCSGLTAAIIPDSVTSIGERAFDSCEGIARVVIGSGVESIGAYAFRGLSLLTDITIPDNVTTIGVGALSGCLGLTEMTIPFVGGSAAATTASESTVFGYIFSSAYSYSDATTVTQYYSNNSSTYAYIPSGLREVTVTGGEILYGAFYNCSMLTSITLPDDLTSIGERAFCGCTGLTEITIPEGVTSIGNYAFYNCTGLSEITIPEGVTSIGSYAFYGCTGLTEITLSEGLTSIGSYAFYNCTGITEITIPEGVTSIGSYAFYGCTGLTEITLSEGLTSIGSYAFYNCTGITEITIPEGVTSIGSYAFGYMDITEITIPDSVTTIGEAAFAGCSGLTEMTIPFVGGSATATSASSSTLFGYIFGTTSYTDATYVIQYNGNYYIPSGLTTVTVTGGSLTHYAFYNCSMLTSVTLEEGVTSIGSYAFRGCTGLTEITIPDSVTSIGSYAFQNCTGLAEITIPFVGTGASSNYPLGYMFGGSNSGMTSVTQYYYTGSSYSSTTYYIPSGLTTVTVTGGSLTPYAFYGCTMLTSVTLEEGVTSIGNYAFYNCTGLTTIEIPEGVTSIGNYAFYGCTMLTSVTLEEGVTSIGNYAFYNCTGLTTIEIPEGVTSIGNYAFYGCSMLTNVSLPEGVTAIGDRAFMDCISLVEIAIPNSVTAIGVSAFQACYDLEKISMPSDLTSIGASAFSGCSKLTEIEIPNGVESIGSYVFYDCSGLTSVVLPNGMASIEKGLFYNCTSLTEITIPESVTSIATEAFWKCSALTEINYGGTADQWFAISFGSDWNYNTGNYKIYCADGTVLSKNSVLV